MAIIPPTQLEVLQGRLVEYLAAEKKILQAQSYQVGDGSVARQLQRAELERVQLWIDHIRSQIAALEAPPSTQRAGIRLMGILRS